MAEKVNALYHSVIVAGTHLAPSIRVAEAAKVIENSQRDINIAFVNELSKIFNLMHIDTQAVLEAAATKWRFFILPARLGRRTLYRCGSLLFGPESSGIRIPSGNYPGRTQTERQYGRVCGQTNVEVYDPERTMYQRDLKVLVLGITFKENCPDVRNTKVVDIIAALKEFDLEVDVYDPWASPEEVRKVYGFRNEEYPSRRKYEAVVLAVAHQEFRSLRLRELCKETVLFMM